MITENIKEMYLKYMCLSEKYYRRYVSNCKKLSDSEIVDIIQKAKTGDEEAIKKVIDSSQHIVVQLSHKYNGVNTLDFMDLVQEANDVIIKSIKSFDLSKDTNFFTFLYFRIKYRLVKYTYENLGLIKLSPYMRKKYNQNYISRSIDHFQDINRDRFYSFSTDSENPETICISEDNKRLVETYLNKLKPQVQEMIKLYYGFYGDKKFTYSEIGRKYNITKSAVGQAIKKGLSDLRINMGKYAES